MKKINRIFFIIAITALLFYKPQLAQAHVLATDGSIGAVLHMDPEDDPVAGQPGNFFFEFKDKTNRFTSTNCYCRMDILQHGKVIYSGALFQQSTGKNTDTGYASFTFAVRDVYQIEIIGKPKNGETFQPFMLTYDVNVSRSTKQQANIPFMTPLLLFIIGIFIILLLLFVYFFRKHVSLKKPATKV